MKEQTAMPGLPKLPPSGGTVIAPYGDDVREVDAYTADQMRAYALAAIQSSRQQAEPFVYGIVNSVDRVVDAKHEKENAEFEVEAREGCRIVPLFAAPPAQAQPFAYFAKHPVSGIWEEVVPSAAWQDGVVEQEVPKIWYMRDNHTFRQLPENVDAALRDIEEELDAGYTSGMLCTKRKGANPRHLHFSYTTPREEMLQRASMWLANEIAARAAKEKA